jgi:ATPase subunit of ABC transporter with duplicated ATPase domains
MRLEVESRAAGGRSPLKAVVGAVLAVGLIGGFVLYRMNVQHKEEQAAAALERQLAEQKAEQKAQAREAEFKAQLASIKREMDEKMKSAKNEADRVRIRAEAEAKEADMERRAGKPHGGTKKSDSTSGTKATPTYKVPGKRDINDDILNGL